ncbi:hypothetical protein ACEPAH_5419 [Sanghuangporus vaninii]
MPLKFAQDKPERDRTRDPNVPIQPHVLTAAELPYRINTIPPSRSVQFSKASSSTVSPPAPASNYSIPYRQRLVAAALAAPTDDQQSSNDSSSAPSSNALSSGVATSSVTSSSSHDTSKGKGKATVADTAPVPPAPRNSPITPSTPATAAGAAHLDPNASYFERLMDSNASRMPPPGLSYFEMRRALWCITPPIPPQPSSPSPSRIKLEALLSQSGAVESEEVWRAGLKNVWKGLVGGNQLRKRLPLHIVLKILQAGWLRDGTWPEGMVAPTWDQPISVSPPSTAPPDDPSQAHAQGQFQAQLQAQQQRRAHEQEAYAAALHARASAEQAHGAAQMMHMQAYAMMGMQGGIPPGYSPSSGDAPEEGYYAMPYAYAEATPPPGGEGVSEGQMERIQNSEQMQDERMREVGREEGPPPTPLRTGQEVESEMDTEDELEEDDDDVVNMDDDSRTRGVVGTGDGRHEGG